MTDMEKYKLISSFDELITFGKESNIFILINKKELSLIDQVIIVDIFISYKLYLANNFKFNTEDCFDEIFNLNKNVICLIADNLDFF